MRIKHRITYLNKIIINKEKIQKDIDNESLETKKIYLIIKKEWRRTQLWLSTILLRYFEIR